MKMGNKLLAAACGFMLLTVVAGCGATPAAGANAAGNTAAANTAASNTETKAPVKASLVLDWTPNADHAGIYEGLAQGYYSQAGLDLHIDIPSDSTNALEQVAAGKSDFAISYETETLFARNKNLPIVAVEALTQSPLNSIIALQKSGITRPRDLKGKKVGMAGLPSDDALLSSVLAADGLTLKDVTTVNVGYDLVPALLGGKVDAIIGGYWNWEAIQIGLKGQPVNVIHLEQWGVPNYNELVVVTSDQTLQQKPDLVKAFVTATAKGYDYAMQHPDDAVNQLLKADNTLDKELVTKSLEALTPVFVAKAPYFGYMNPDEWQRYNDWLVKEKLMSAPVDINKAMTNSFLGGSGQ